MLNNGTVSLQEHLVAPVRKALSYYTHMGKTMEEELKKEQVKKQSREENQEKVSSFSVLLYRERFSVKCRKTKTKVITLTNHNSRKQSNELIRARSKYMSSVPSAGKRVRVSHDWFWFDF